jgi:hypothetical protein
MFTKMECEALKLLIEEEILSIEFRGPKTDNSIMTNYLVALGTIRDKLEVMTTENIGNIFEGIGCNNY